MSDYRDYEREAWERGYKKGQEDYKRRERIATAAMQGLMSREFTMSFQGFDSAPSLAVDMADALIAALDAKPESEEE